MLSIPIPAGTMPAQLHSLAPDLAAAAQSVYDAWEQKDGWDEELGQGGICQDIASAMVSVLNDNGFEHSLSVAAAVGENHVFVVALLPDHGIYEIDIPPSTYEIGSGYVWKKRNAVRMTGEDVAIERIADPTGLQEFENTYCC